MGITSLVNQGPRGTRGKPGIYPAEGGTKDQGPRTIPGTLFDIRRFAVHDGPGIRTTVFVKGCMLNCAWCQNPEGIDLSKRLWHFSKRCIECGRCVDVCPQYALTLRGHRIRIDRDICTGCGSCVDACPTCAMAFDGRDVASSDVVAELLSDQVFYEVSDGGITLSGGDPLCQAEFSRAILEGVRKHGVHTALETCLAAKWALVKSFLPLVDLFMVDIKLDDADAHERWTGQRNRRIKSNLRRLARSGAGLLIRIPLIPGATATDKNLSALARFIRAAAPTTPVELINFNPLARSKYRQRGLKSEFDRVDSPFDAEQVARFRALLEAEQVCILTEDMA